MFEITVYDAAQSAARKGLLVHKRIVLVGVAEGFVPDITLGLKSPYHRRDSIEMGLRLGRQINKLADKQRPVAPEASHQLLFAACEFFHRSIIFIFTPYIYTVIINCLLPTHQGIVCPIKVSSAPPSWDRLHPRCRQFHGLHITKITKKYSRATILLSFITKKFSLGADGSFFNYAQSSAKKNIENITVKFSVEQQ